MGLWKLLQTASRSVRARGKSPLEVIPVAGGTARVCWSRRRVPTIEAGSAAGAVHALGRIHAEERLWQLDLLRKVGHGELSRLFGDRPVDWRQSTIHHAGLTIPDLDYFLRCFGLPRAAQATLDRTSDATRELLRSYARGVNDGIAERRRSLEHALLGVEPEPWTLLDSVAVTKVFAFNLCFAWKAKLAFRALQRQLGPSDLLLRLLPREWRAEWPRIVKMAGQAPAPGQGSQELLELDQAVRAFTGGLGAHLGSNSWVVGGGRTRSGKPVLCGDPHLEATAPPPFFLARLRGGDLDVSGATVPGVPVPAIGRNRRLAWSCTNAMADDCDLYVVRTGQPLPETPGAPTAALESLLTTIEVRGEEARQRVIRVCRGATLISPALGNDLSYGPGEALAMRWNAVELPGQELDGWLGVARARDFDQFRAAIALIGSPAQNFSYADVDGHIGYVLSGAFPIRRGGPSVLARDLGDPEGDWVGAVPKAELPAVLDPPEGVVAHANNEVVAGWRHYLSCLWEPPHRIRRIVERLEPLRDATLDDVAAVHTDVRSLMGLELIEHLLRPRAEALAALRPDGASALQALLEWDGECRPDSRGAAVFHVFYDELLRVLAQHKLGPAFVPFREVWVEQLKLAEDLLEPGNPWLLGRSASEVLARALAATTDRLDRLHWEQGHGRWTWGELHQGTFRHPLGALPGVGFLFQVGPFAAWGSSYTVWNGHYSHADPFRLTLTPALRWVCDLSREDSGAAEAVLTTGQSGDPLSPDYRSLFPLWLRGERVRLDE